MPMYEYICKQCNTEFFEVIPYDKRDDVVCPTCGGKPKRKLSNAHFVMDGKMQTTHPNSPEGQARAREIKKKHWKKGKKEHDAWVNENKARAKVDGKFSYS